jgi:hypothetical protein
MGCDCGFMEGTKGECTCNKRYEKEHKRKDTIEILKLAGVLEEIDDEVADLCIKIMPKGNDKLISMADLMKGVQKIKNHLTQQKQVISREKLRTIMINKGYNIISVPSGKGLMIRYTKNKIPYSTVISEFELEDIINKTKQKGVGL